MMHLMWSFVGLEPLWIDQSAVDGGYARRRDSTTLQREKSGWKQFWCFIAWEMVEAVMVLRCFGEGYVWETEQGREDEKVR